MARKEGAAAEVSIWWFAFGYFAAYVPYSAMTKAITSGWFEGQTERVSGFTVTPMSVLASVIGMYIFLTAMGWWRFASRRELLGRSWPSPTRVTLVSGLLTAGIVVTTTLAYTFQGVSIVFMMLLMRGGVLILAPVVDSLTGRPTRWFSWVGLGLSLAALGVAFSEPDSGGAPSGRLAMSTLAVVDVALYLACYFFRLRFMSRHAKHDDPNASRRYFVEEQMVGTPALFLILVVLAFIVEPLVPAGSAHTMLVELRAGFTDIWVLPVWPAVVGLGIFSQFTGIFGGLVLLDKRENTFCVPVNRSSSILAGVVASFALLLVFGRGAPSSYDLAGAGLIIVAILVLTLAPLAEKARRAPEAPR